MLAGILFIALSYLAGGVRWDFTADKRYTPSETALKIIRKPKEHLHITVFLEGEFPAYFKKLRSETYGLLEQFRRENKNITFDFVNPEKKGKDFVDKLIRNGYQPAEISVQKGNELSQIRIFPWAEIEYDGKTEQVPLLVSLPGASIEEQINRSIENLEYAFAYRINKITRKEKPKIAILKGNGEWDDIYIADFLMSLRDFYRLAPFTLDSLETQPGKTIEQLRQYDVAVIAGPTEKFSRLDKFALDQFIMNGGRMLLLFDPVKAHKDTLLHNYKTYALNAELETEDWLFFYGIRPKPVLVKDLVAAPVVLKVGDVQGNPQLLKFPWVYSPLVKPEDDHPIGKNTGQVKLDFVSVLDTLKNPLKQTVLIYSSPYTDLVGVPAEINFEDIARKPDEKQFNKGRQILGVLVEGRFKSAFEGRVKPVDDIPFKNQAETKIIVIADGDIIKNDIKEGQPLPLGLDKWSGIQYDNKNFLLNAVHYLADKEGLYLLKNKSIRLSLIDKNKAVAENDFWRFFNLLVLVFLLAGFVLLMIFMRRRKYRKFNV
jgi:gliding-associated putative ABC transporter substrate-binding component GldG